MSSCGDSWADTDVEVDNGAEIGAEIERPGMRRGGTVSGAGGGARWLMVGHIASSRGLQRLAAG